MGRVQRKKIEKENKRIKKYRSLLIIAIMLVGISGIFIVDHSLRARMMMEQQKIIIYERDAKGIYRFNIYGKEFELDGKALRDGFKYIKKEMQYYMGKASGYIIKMKGS